MKVNRRQFVRRAATVTVGAGLGAGYYAWRLEPHWIEVVERRLPLADLPKRWEGRRLVQLSDLHTSRFVEHDYLRRAMAQAVELQPDLVAVTGDVMTSRRLEQIEPTVDILRLLEPERRAVFVVAGNHEYGEFCAHPNQCDTLFARLANVGIRPLRNECVEHDGLQIVGFDEVMARRFRPRRALESFDASRPGLALTHNPDTLDLPGWDGFTGWVLAGHTHGGQCRMPCFGAPFVPIQNRRYVAGEVQVDQRRQLYVNRGLGYTRRVRFFCPPEITLFHLTRTT